MSAGWMTSKGGGWGRRLVTGATQGGPTCPTRSGLVLHPPSARTSWHRPDSSPTRPGLLRASGERPETQDPGFKSQRASRLIPSRCGVPTHTHSPTCTPTELQVEAEFGSGTSIGYTSLCPPAFPAVFFLDFLGNQQKDRPVPSLASLDDGILAAERVGLCPRLCVESSAPTQTTCQVNICMPLHIAPAALDHSRPWA